VATAAVALAAVAQGTGSAGLFDAILGLLQNTRPICSGFDCTATKSRGITTFASGFGRAAWGLQTRFLRTPSRPFQFSEGAAVRAMVARTRVRSGL
jgi:hypothetical protein